MRILHTSDWHLGIQLHGVPLLEEQRYAMQRLVHTVEAHRVDAVVIAGDLFDHAVARPEVIALYDEMMRSLCTTCGVSVLLCAGNHDGAARLSACGQLLRQAGLYISGSLEQAFVPIVLEDTAFFLLPWFQTDQARALFPDAELRTNADAMQFVCDRIRENRLPDKRNLLVAHCFAAGGETSESDRTAVVGGAGRIPLPVFEGFDYVALGHLHRAQQLAPHVRYSGTPYPYSFAETGQQKSFTLLDTSTMQLEMVDAMIDQPRTLRELRGAFDPLQSAARWDCHREDYLHITLTDTMPGAERLALLRADYPNLLLLEGIPHLDTQEREALTLAQLATLTPHALVTRFCEETIGMTPDEEQLAWLDEALLHEEVHAQ